MGFTLQEFSEINLKRCTSLKGFNHTLDSWKPSEWTNAMAGECGEACNITKKISRHEQGINGNVKPEDQNVDALRARAIREIADVIVYADLAIQALGGNTSNALRDVFNDKSTQIGAPFFIK